MKSLIPFLFVLTACGGAAPEAAPAPAEPAPAEAPAAAPAEAAPAAADATAAAAPDAKHGAEIVGQKCTSCHTADVFTRPDRKVKTPEALATQVDGCSNAAGLDATAKADVSAYLKGTYGF
jgi:2-oxoglutarate dehydrogenase E2 component (dihydrolipoamide succinyltransferase)